MRTRGFATTIEELERGLVAIAAPVHAPDGSVLAAISISAPTIRLTTPARLDELSVLLLQHTAELSERLGYHEPKRGAA